MIFTSHSAFLAALCVVLAALLLVSRFAKVRRAWPLVAAITVAGCAGLVVVGLVQRSHEAAHAREQMISDTRFLAEQVVQSEQQKLKDQGAYSSLSYRGPVSLEVIAVDGTHATAHVWSKAKDLRFKITPSGAKPDPNVAG